MNAKLTLAPIHEDASVLAFDKPAGLSVQGGSGVAESLEDLLKAYAKPGKPLKLVHRLDRETSGVIVVAKNRTSAAALAKAFAERAAVKSYLAIVCAAPAPPEGVIAAPLKKASRQGLDIMRIAQAGEKGALSAFTRYRTLSSGKHGAVVALMPETGRMHQLRVHLAAIGAPMAGDGKYGGLFALGAVTIPGLMLHAWSLKLPHPKGGTLELEAPPPRAFLETASALDLAVPVAPP